MTATNNVRKPETNMQNKYTESELLNAAVRATVESKMDDSSIQHILILTSTYDTIELGILAKYDTIELGILKKNYKIVKTSVKFSWEGQEDKTKEAILNTLVNPGVYEPNVPVSRTTPIIDFMRWVENIKRNNKKREGKAC